MHRLRIQERSHSDDAASLTVKQMNARYKKRLGFIDVLSQVQVQKVPDPLRWQPALPA